jgi:uncharacterized protein (DUF1499 family)
MGFIRWFTKNWANTTEPTHRDLGPLTLSRSPSEVVQRLQSLTGRWKVIAADGATVRLTRTTPVCRFVDDLTLTLTPAANGTLVHAESRSRVGVGDLGQNRRNILELWTLLREPGRAGGSAE